MIIKSKTINTFSLEFRQYFDNDNADHSYSVLDDLQLKTILITLYGLFGIGTFTNASGTNFKDISHMVEKQNNDNEIFNPGTKWSYFYREDILHYMYGRFSNGKIIDRVRILMSIIDIIL